MSVVGCDACPQGWVAVELNESRFARAVVQAEFEAVLAAFPRAEAVGVDIPIGLPESGWRPADLEARRFIGRRWPSVFRTPTRALLETPWSPGLGISLQAHGMGRRIFEVERVADGRVREVHPEVSFRELAGAPLAHSKRTWNGQQERLRLLGRAGVRPPPRLEGAGQMPADDLIDAAVVAWSAQRIALGQALSFPARAPARARCVIWR
ncbi:MAG TPA: DUF429 domain-containing protein [Candidatus Acidoferrales bacterium]|nr:DUF429 domain-containing protein [Candidatus Acidoferrales bacterium]